MDYKQFITRNPEILQGKPIISGTRITVELIMRKMASGYTMEQLLASYPHISQQQILAAFEYAANPIANEEVVEIV